MNTNTPFSQEITLKDAILTTRAYAWELLYKWYWFVLFIGIFVGFTHYYIQQQPVTYTANISFMTNSNSGNRMSGLLQIAGQFGLGGSGGGGSEASTEKIMELLTSKRNIYTTLLKKVVIDDKEDLLFNHYIRLFNLHKLWAKSERLHSFTFSNKPIKQFDFTDNLAAQQIYGRIRADFLRTSISKSGIMRALCETRSDVFAKVFLEELVNTLADYYSRKSIEQQRKTYNIVERRVDSIYNALHRKEYALADWIDNHRTALRAGTLSAQVLMEQERLKSEAEILNVMYGEAVKNREIAHMNLLSRTPIIQVIDYPTLPLSVNMIDGRNLYIIAFVLAVFLVTILVSFNKLLHDAMKS